MRRSSLWLGAGALAAVLSAPAAQIQFTLAGLTSNQVPYGTSLQVAGQGPLGQWGVVQERDTALFPEFTNGLTATHPVLAQISQTPLADHFPLLLYTNETLANFTLTTRFKILSGVIAPEAGLVFRVQDPRNYYVVRASAQGNVLWYRVVNGVRYENQGIGVRRPIETNHWYELAVECSGNQFRCLLDGQLILPPARPGAPTNDLAINDNTFATGTAGLMTSADTTAYFTDTRIDYTPRVPVLQVALAEVFRRNSKLLGLQIYAMRNAPLPVLVADGKGAELGSPGRQAEADVLSNGVPLYLKLKDAYELTMPLRDRNGDIFGAMRVTMPAFTGETLDTATSRALLIKDELEKKLDKLEDLNQ